MKAKQQARQRAFEVELKKQCQKLIPIITGLCWQYTNSNTHLEKTLAEYEVSPSIIHC
jgi:hypothetical protein